jgi:hypothetical protein
MEEQFRKIINLHYGDYLIKRDSDTSSGWDLLASIVEVCNDGDMNGIKLAFDRIDGLQETPVKFNLPKFYVRYKNATSKAELGPGTEDEQPVVTSGELITAEDAQKEIDAMGLRKVLEVMQKMPKKLPYAIKLEAEDIEKKHKTGVNVAGMGQLVKTVMVAGLLRMAQNGNPRAIGMVFDQIEGKLMRVITLLNGEDVYVDNVIDTVAPAHAIKDENGIWVADDRRMEMIWIAGFAKQNKGLEGLLDEGRD